MGRLAAATVNQSPVTEGDKRLQWRRFFATGDLAQQPPQKNRNSCCLEARTPELIQKQCPSIRGDTFLKSWQVNNWSAGRQGEKSQNEKYFYKICNECLKLQDELILVCPWMCFLKHIFYFRKKIMCFILVGICAEISMLMTYDSYQYSPSNT